MCFIIATTKEGIKSFCANKHLLKHPSEIFMLCSQKPTKCIDRVVQHGSAWHQEHQESLFSAAWQTGKNILQQSVYQPGSLTISAQCDWETGRRKQLHQRAGQPQSFLQSQTSLEKWLQITLSVSSNSLKNSLQSLKKQSFCQNYFYADVYNEWKEMIRNARGVCGVGTGRCSRKETQI